MGWSNLKGWQKVASVIALSIVIVVAFLYGYAFLYDYFYAKNFPQIPITAYAANFDPAKFTDNAVSFIVEMANALKAAVS